MDDVDNEYLFGDRLQEILTKITSAKQKSKSLFTGLQKKATFAYSSTSGATNYHQSPFRQGVLPQENQGGRERGMFFARGNKKGTSYFSSVTLTESGNSQCRKFSTSPLSSEKFDFSIESFIVSCSGMASIFSSELGEANKRSVYFKHSSRVSNPIPVKNVPRCLSACDSNEFRTKNFSRSGITENAEKGGIKPAHSSQKQFLSPIFLVPKKDSGQRPVLTLKKLNQNIPYAHFKIEGFFLLKELLQENNYMCKINLKYAYFSAPPSPELQKFVR